MCILITADETSLKNIQPALQQAVPDAENYLQKGQLEIISLRQWLPRGSKSEKSLIAKWDKVIFGSFDGLRLAFAFSPDNPRMVSISSSLDKVLNNFNAIALFCYPRDIFSAVGLMEVVKNHERALTKNSGKWEVIESSEARISQNALNRSEEKLRTLFSYMSEGFAHLRIMLDKKGKPSDYIFMEVNEAFEKILEPKTKDIIGKKVTEVLPGIEKDPTDWIGKFGRVALTGRPAQFESYSEALKRWYRVSAFSSQKGFFSVIFTDITERKIEEARMRELLGKEQNLAEELEVSNEELRATTEELQTANEELIQQTGELSGLNLALEESKQRFSSAFHASPAALSISNLDDGMFIDVNEAFERLFGYNRKDLIGHRPVPLYINPDERVNIVRNLQKLGSVSNFEVKARTKSGEEITTLVSAVVTEINKKKSILWTSLDITERKKAEEDLKKSEAHSRFLADIVEKASVAVGIGFPDGRLGIVNQAFCKLTGYSAEDLKTVDWAKALTPPEYNALEAEKLAQLSATGEPVTYQKEYIRKDGTRVPIELIVHLVRDDRGNAQYYYSFINNITERKKAEEELKGSEQRYRNLFENMIDGYAFCQMLFENGKPEDFIYKAVNKSFEKLTGLKNVVGKKVSEIIPGIRGTNPELFEIYGKVASTGRPERFEIYLDQLNIWLSISVYSSEKGTFTAVFENITERKEAEGALAKAKDDLEVKVKERTAQVMEERHRLFNVLETLPTMICLLTPHYHVAFANRSFRQVFGESRGRPCYEYCFGRKEPCEFCESYKVLETGKPHHWEVNTPDGKVIDAYDFPFRDINGSPMILEMDIDITDRKRAEAELHELNETLEQRVTKRTAELESANKELESFSYSVSHDLRAPLRTLDGFSEMMLEDYSDKLDEAGKDYLNRIRTASHTMSELIEAILKLSRISRAEVHQDKVDLSDFARSISEGLKFSQPDRQAEFIIEPNLIVRGDLELLRIALNNLFENAWKYTGKCTQTRIEFGITEQSGEKVYFIKDNGVGFDMQYKDKLFQPFQRLHTSNDYQGTGIGLATIQRVIRRHNGRIWAESEIGKGTTFFFTLG